MVRTDTLYGIIACINDEAAVEKVYKVKRRDPNKQCIVLIADPSDVPAYADLIDTYSNHAETPTSVVVPVSTEPAWIVRDGNSVAYRVVHNPFLKKVIREVGPVVAPSANPEGWEPAHSIEEAKEYFGNQVDVYIDGGVVPKNAHASRIAVIAPDGTVDFIR